MLAAFGINEGISILFYNQKRINLDILHKFLRLTKIKTVSDTSDSFWGQKWPIFAPKTAILANFGIDKGVLYFFNIQNG